MGISLDETASREDIVALLECFGAEADVDALAKATEGKSALLSGASARTGEFLQHSVFNSYHSETQMLRYLFKLQSRDLSLTTSMISLGSCTMKVRTALVAAVLCEPRGDRSLTHTRALFTAVERDVRDDPSDVARVWRHAPIRTRRASSRLRGAGGYAQR